jgi:hypothetical protein
VKGEVDEFLSSKKRGIWAATKRELCLEKNGLDGGTRRNEALATIAAHQTCGYSTGGWSVRWHTFTHHDLKPHGDCTRKNGESVPRRWKEMRSTAVDYVDT